MTSRKQDSDEGFSERALPWYYYITRVPDSSRQELHRYTQMHVVFVTETLLIRRDEKILGASPR
jgi:hypothetical protein